MVIRYRDFEERRLGPPENSPALQRWDKDLHSNQVPQGTKEISSAPPLRSRGQRFRMNAMFVVLRQVPDVTVLHGRGPILFLNQSHLDRAAL